jgi:PAS domain S-box-containing protein
MRAGAKDFIAKSRLSRLVPAILREVGEARNHARAEVVRAERDDAEGRLSAIVGNALDGILMMDDRGRISFWNPAAERIFGYPQAEAQGRDLHQLIAPERFLEVFRTAFNRFRENGEGDALGKVLELTGQRKDGSEFPLEITVAPLRTGDAWHAVGILRDISERKRMEEDLSRSQGELRQLALYLQDIAEGDRKALAREIHDELGQAMTALKMDLNSLALVIEDPNQLGKIRSMTRLVNGTIKVIQRLQSDLRPNMLDDLGLGDTLRWQLDEFAERSRLACSMDLSANLEGLGEGMSLAIFRIFQEALTNVARHAEATRVHVETRAQAGSLVLEIRDDGKGISPGEFQSNKSFGIMSMRERALALNGTLEVGARPEGGTCLVLRVPLPAGGEAR